MSSITWTTSPNRGFVPDPARRSVSHKPYVRTRDRPLVSPYGNVLPARLGTPAEMFIIPDHSVLRMLYSQSVALEDLSVSSRDSTPVQTDHRRGRQRFAEHLHLFNGTPSGPWIEDTLNTVVGVEERRSLGARS